ncbi:hypothetical protein Ping_1783 [Psychromonas ingrahamii 37]|uniref:Uncharacterized protein n=1 Tax=Psychromonas ingrahamii (strain DSM 17664 / CCUG 51855 / 37) TaxID=357804 RepID=A1SVP8_PSYIN|nr:hypothetical protein [Psychromonas ingrahamii]ABM03563.1 hypothetical protein Ping_1783 [Psychromonas ingrahamii 37]
MTYHPGASSYCLFDNPGKTLETFSGPLFPGGVFSGYYLAGDRAANFSYEDERDLYDSTSYKSRNSAEFRRNGYYFTADAWPLGNHSENGMALAVTSMNLSFLVTEGDSSIDLGLDHISRRSRLLRLYDETSGIAVANLMGTVVVMELLRVCKNF